MFPNQSIKNNEGAEVAASILIDGTMDGTQNQHQQQSINYNEPQQSNQNKGVHKKPFVKITEQPATKALRFRYECEGRSAGSIPGINSMPENKTYPTIEIVGYKGRAVVVVSCVTKEQPYRPHPHNLVGKEGCKKGVCTLEINSETMRAVFSNLGIQCVKKKDIESALKAREDIRVDPFKTGFSHRFQPSSIDLNVVRLCFQVFMESEHKGRFTQPLPPVVSDPIYDKKAMSDLVICRLCSCSASVLGNTQIILLCEKVAKEDIAVRFFEEHNNQIVWEAYGEFQHTDVHKQTAITFKTPRYHTVDIIEPAKVFIQLRRPSDGMTSEALHFEYIPLDSGRQPFTNLRRSHKRKPDLDLFQKILSLDISNSPTFMVANSAIVTDLDEPNFHNEKIKTKKISSVKDLINSSTPMEVDQIKHIQSQQEANTILYKTLQEVKQETVTMSKRTGDYQNKEKELPSEFPHQIYSTEKINKWMEYNESRTLGSKEYTGIFNYDSDLINDDKTLNDLLEQVVELDEIYSDHVNCPVPDTEEFALQNNEQQNFVDCAENFDDAATYSSLQIAFKHPIEMPTKSIIPITSLNNLEQKIVMQDFEHKNTSYFGKPVADDKRLPPLPPKRIRKLDPEYFSNECNQIQMKESPIIIMKTPDRIPSPCGSLKIKDCSLENPVHNKNNTMKQKKGFFSKLFSRHKSNSNINHEGTVNVNCALNLHPRKESRKYSTKHVNGNNTHSVSMRSITSFQNNSWRTSATDLLDKPVKNFKPVGRSISSVSGKRSARLITEITHIPLKGESVNSLSEQEIYSHASTITLDCRTVSALQVADIPISEGNMELVAIADRQSLRNLCEGEFNIQLDSNVDLTEAEHFALYTTVPSQETTSEFDEYSGYGSLNPDEILTTNEIAKRLIAVNRGK